MHNFESFSKNQAQRHTDPQITVLQRGTLSLNRSAYLALGSPKAVELLYDSGDRVVGLRPTDVHAPNAAVVRQPSRGEKGPFLVTAMAFARFYGIDTTQSLRREAVLEDGILCMGLDDAATPVTSNRARKSTVMRIVEAEHRRSDTLDERREANGGA